MAESICSVVELEWATVAFRCSRQGITTVPMHAIQATARGRCKAHPLRNPNDQPTTSKKAMAVLLAITALSLCLRHNEWLLYTKEAADEEADHSDADEQNAIVPPKPGNVLV